MATSKEAREKQTHEKKVLKKLEQALKALGTNIDIEYSKYAPNIPLVQDDVTGRLLRDEFTRMPHIVGTEVKGHYGCFADPHLGWMAFHESAKKICGEEYAYLLEDVLAAYAKSLEKLLPTSWTKGFLDYSKNGNAVKISDQEHLGGSINPQDWEDNRVTTLHPLIGNHDISNWQSNDDVDVIFSRKVADVESEKKNRPPRQKTESSLVCPSCGSAAKRSDYQKQKLSNTDPVETQEVAPPAPAPPVQQHGQTGKRRAAESSGEPKKQRSVQATGNSH